MGSICAFVSGWGPSIQSSGGASRFDANTKIPPELWKSRALLGCGCVNAPEQTAIKLNTLPSRSFLFMCVKDVRWGLCLPVSAQYLYVYYSPTLPQAQIVWSSGTSHRRFKQISCYGHSARGLKPFRTTAVCV